MSNQVYIAFIGKNNKEYHDAKDHSRIDAAYAEAKDFVQKCGLENEDVVVDYLGQEGDLTL